METAKRELAAHRLPVDEVLKSFYKRLRHRAYYLAEWDDAPTGAVELTVIPPKFSSKTSPRGKFNMRWRSLHDFRLHEHSRVYFIREPLGGFIKIGIALDVAVRLSALQSAHPYPLTVIGICPGGQAAETVLHKEFAADRLVGEWFKPSPALRARIRELCVRPAKAKAAPAQQAA